MKQKYHPFYEDDWEDEEVKDVYEMITQNQIEPIYRCQCCDALIEEGWCEC